MTKDEKLRQAIRDLYDELSERELPYFVTNKISDLMDKFDIEHNEQHRGVSAG